MGRTRPIKEEEAYQEWARLPDKHDRSAMRQLSQSMGVPLKTLYDWKDRYQWIGRWLADVHAVSPHTLEIGLATLVEGWPLVTARLLSNIINGDDKDSTNAIKVYAQLTGGDKRAPLAPTGGVRKQLDPALVSSIKELSREELWRLTTEAGAENMDRALRERSSRRTVDRMNNP